MAVVTYPPRQKMSKEEFLALPEGPPDYEFEQGEVIPVVRPHAKHQKLVLRLGAALDHHVSGQNLGAMWIEIDVLLTEDRIYIPDIVYLSQEHMDRYHEDDGKIHGAPDLVVEILLPHSPARDATCGRRVWVRGKRFGLASSPDWRSICTPCCNEIATISHLLLPPSSLLPLLPPHPQQSRTGAFC